MSSLYMNSDWHMHQPINDKNIYKMINVLTSIAMIFSLKQFQPTDSCFIGLNHAIFTETISANQSIFKKAKDI